MSANDVGWPHLGVWVVKTSATQEPVDQDMSGERKYLRVTVERGGGKRMLAIQRWGVFGLGALLGPPDKGLARQVCHYPSFIHNT